MTTINNIDDLLRLLRENPEYAAELRRYILTEELLRLPAQLTAFVELSDRRYDELRDYIRILDERFSQHSAQVNENIRRVETAVGEVRGLFAVHATAQNIRDLIAQMGFNRRRTLTKDDILDLTEGRWTAMGIGQADIASFHAADFIVEVEDEAGERAFVTVEASFTVDGHDVERAVRNAGLMTRFTGAPCHPAVTGVRYHESAAEAINTGRVAWRAIPEGDLRPS